MRQINEIKNWANRNKNTLATAASIAGTAGCFAIGWYIGDKYIWSRLLKPTETISAAPAVFDIVRTDIEVKDAFATVEYSDGSVSLVDDIIGLAECIAKRDGVTMIIK